MPPLTFEDGLRHTSDGFPTSGLPALMIAAPCVGRSWKRYQSNRLQHQGRADCQDQTVLRCLSKDTVKAAFCRFKSHLEPIVEAQRCFFKLLDHIAEEVLPESQSGFRKERRTVYMVFVARQFQKRPLNNSKLCTIFVDLTKAFDTVNRTLLWEILRKFGCSSTTFLVVLRSFHDGSMAKKTEVLNMCQSPAPEFLINNMPLKNVEEFTYLGSVLSSTNDLTS
ncbi:uncharacterized protein LOC143037314 [Oratosquilla oratoria]|uniref:uncharacterized protein LOC143037314 n=1 Tax=Oratosquilla oratoria TaxID=337810 RepID=UPI003F759120